MPRILFVADGRSPIAVNWINYFLEREAEIHLVSSFPCVPDPRLASFTFVPVAFSELKRSISGAPTRPHPIPKTAPWFANRLRQWLGPLTLPRASQKLRKILERIQPELIHAMRIPYEGMLAARALQFSNFRGTPPPLLISVWGNDFTLHAPSTPLMRHFTRETLLKADALHADCQRDVRLAREWDFKAENPTIVLPGAGGVQPEIFYPGKEPVVAPLAINPRGIRTYVNNAAFFQAIPLILEQVPEARFVCPAMAETPQIQHWVNEFGISQSVGLLPVQTRPQMAELFRQARVAVSPSIHDGTPNTLLEAMACGCLPVAGDLESLREWITSGQNGLLVDSNSPSAIAKAIINAFRDDELLLRGRKS